MFQIDLFYRDADWKETEHPRGGNTQNPGQFSKGYGAGSEAETHNIPKHTNTPSQAVPLTALQTAALAHIQGGHPSAKTTEILKQIAAKYSHPHIASYANTLLRFLEQHHGAGAGSFGKAVHKGAGPPEPAKPPPEPPPEPVKPPPEPPAKPEKPAGKVNLISLVEGELAKGTPTDQIAAILKEKAAGFSAIYSNKILRLMEKNHGLVRGSLGNPVVEPGKATPAPPLHKPPEPPPAFLAKAEDTPEQLREKLHKAIAGKFDKVEQDWHKKAFENSSLQLINAMAGTKPLREIEINPSAKVSHYQGGGSGRTHQILMAYHSSKSDDAQIVWRHEYGHAIDYDGEGSPKSYELGEDKRVEDEKKFLARVRKGVSGPADPPPGATAKQQWLAERLKDTGVTPEEVNEHAGGSPWRAAAISTLLKGDPVDSAILDSVGRAANEDGLFRRVKSDAMMLGDFIGSFTKNKVGAGHSNEYYEVRRHRQCAEMFANYVALTNGKSGKVYRAILHNMAPDTCKVFDQILDTAGKGAK